MSGRAVVHTVLVLPLQITQVTDIMVFHTALEYTETLLVHLSRCRRQA